MSDTMISMELVYADTLNPDQLLDGDIVKSPNDGMVTITGIEEISIGYLIKAIDDYDDDVEFLLTDNSSVMLYVYREEEDD